MVVQFYNFSKKQNSTARPPASALIKSTECYLKEGCSVVNPSIRVAWAADNMLPTYAYIPTWGRYYFITDTSYVNSALVVDMSCDVLATYKTQIGASTQYVLRSAAAKNPMIIDSMYPTQTKPDVMHRTANTPFNAVGCYILGVIGRGSGYGTGTGKGLTYYCMSPAQMDTFVSWANSWDTASDMAAAFATELDTTVDAIAGQMLHVFDYIKTAFWIPLAFTDIAGEEGRIVLGGYQSPATIKAYKVANFNKLYTGTVPSAIICGFYLPDHPQAATNGAWMNAAPYTTHYIDVPFLGDIAVPSEFHSGDSIVVKADISMIDGSAQFYVYGEPDDTEDSIMIGRYQAQIGVPIPINVVRSDIGGAVSSGLGAIGSLLTGNFLGAAAGIASAVQSAIPAPHTIGGLAGYHTTGYQAELVTTCWPIPATDNTNHGSPLCDRRVISGLPGYIQTSGAALALAATDVERGQVTSQMDAGFFYE